ncbi:MAG: hypothetical protein KKE17_04285 [Proteobacteria bacterium]|nr:hypothetical protein [Pseudomonadota bacterium]MBU1709204.1 hypothetical protein [Pseudomonadota bacterium]
MIRNKIFYAIKPFIPRRLQIALRRVLAQRRRKLYKDVWPIDAKAAKPPDHWSGWPDQKQFAFVLTHDVECMKGVKKCLALSELEEKLGFRSSFNFVLKDYAVPPEIRRILDSKGFEVGIHGVTHDGRSFMYQKSFQEQSVIINQYLKDWGAVGYRTPSMLGTLEWMHNLNIEYDASTFDTDPFEPKPLGAGTIFPYWEHSHANGSGFVELPYTLPQDFTLFVILQEKSFDIWARKLDWIAENGGMALLITHPDYMSFGGKDPGLEEYSAEIYEKFLEYVRSRYEGKYWHALPRDVAHFMKQSKAIGR